MPTALPPINDLQGVGTTPTSDAFRAAIGQQHTFISEKLGSSGLNSDAQTALGGGTVGKAVFVSATTDPALSALGAGTIGKPVFTSNTVDAALTGLGGTTYGKNIFQIADEYYLASLLGAGSISTTDANIHVLLGEYHSAQAGTSVVTTDAAGVATITFPREFLSLLTNTQPPNQPAVPFFAIVSLGDINSMSAIAPLASSYTSTTMQIKCAANVTIRVNWLAVAQYRPFTI